MRKVDDQITVRFALSILLMFFSKNLQILPAEQIVKFNSTPKKYEYYFHVTVN